MNDDDEVVLEDQWVDIHDDKSNGALLDVAKKASSLDQLSEGLLTQA